MKKFMALITAGLIAISGLPVFAADTAKSTTTQEETAASTPVKEEAPITDQNIIDAMQYGLIRRALR